MASFLLRCALVEYTTSLLGPLPNIVVFQFNPEQLSRSFQIAQRTTTPEEAARQREPSQTGSAPVESFNITAHFSAADDLGEGGAKAAIPRVFGIGPQLSALERMIQPKGGVGGILGAAIDAVGSALGLGGAEEAPGRPVPRVLVPRLLFIWGPARVLPVEIRSLSITEKQFDRLLNPVLAEVQIGIEVVSLPPTTDDVIGEGALNYTQTIKDAQAFLNLAKSAELALDIVSF